VNENEQATPQKQICTIRILLIVASDEEALQYKKKVTEIFGSNPDAQVTFGLANNPPKMPNGVA